MSSAATKTTTSPVHAEVLLRRDSRSQSSDAERIRRHVREWLAAKHVVGTVRPGQIFRSSQLSEKLVHDGVDEIVFEEASPPTTRDSASVANVDTAMETCNGDAVVDTLTNGGGGVTCPEASCIIDATTPLHVHAYRLEEGGPEVEEVEDEAGVPAAHQWLLPCREFHGLWSSLVYDDDVKQSLLNFVEATLLLSDRGVDSNIISWNRVVLLHGPPGTGKTSLCKALAQKLSVRLNSRYRYAHLVEVNSHSLFSKWFSESGKLVHKMFARIQELIDDSAALVCVLIDEVESLTAARRAGSGSEPSDAIRVVNAVLTQLDQIRRHSNVLILTTSNITGAIDLAFVDRADIRQLIPTPSTGAIYQILVSCISELERTGVVQIPPLASLFSLDSLRLTRFVEGAATCDSLRLWRLAQRCCGLSGRSLRKLPFLAVARLAGQAEVRAAAAVTLSQFMAALEATVVSQFRERQELASTSSTSTSSPSSCPHCGRSDSRT